ncbi:hypothetical protein NSQ61_17125 [Aeribacillus sp. FSL K6-1121]|uniref:hypothetical protein n=1 Tax=Aeribacillus TaxID=1055323 RepID=UPI002E245B58|nr:hypothetical protein [Aeribacillus composti]
MLFYESREPYTNLSDIWDEIHYLGYLGDTAWKNYKLRKSVIENITDLIQDYKEINIFLSDISWPLNNMIFGKFKKFDRKNITFCNFPDGIGNLLLDPFSFKEKIKIVIKSSLKYFGYFPYYYYSGDRMGMKYFDKVYSFMPHLLIKKK